GVARQYPQVPGIDLAGTVAASADPRFVPGQAVLVTGYGLGVSGPGGWASCTQVPGDWVMPRPPGLGARAAMLFGTPGLTAAAAQQTLAQCGLPSGAEVLISGATGAVGSMAVSLFAASGYRVCAVTGHLQAAERLRALGAADVWPREQLLAPGTGLGHARFDAAFDTVGGPILAAILSQMRYAGVVAACGQIAGSSLNTTVYPFILRAVRLLGIDSVYLPKEQRTTLWAAWAAAGVPEALERCVEEVPLEALAQALAHRRTTVAPQRLLIRLESAERPQP
ncbi:MAG TPA: zinc-binding dehydrogenase, partial [Acidiferrobacteraceae bacterium]|nr:zinc-binding dehydrogenase [Acidiferrobacteraceae bacterium]